MIPSLYQELETFGYSPFTTGHYGWYFSPTSILTPIYITDCNKTTFYILNPWESVGWGMKESLSQGYNISICRVI
jgi:hypothetical protein